MNFERHPIQENKNPLRFLDVVFVIDSTGSMNPFIEEVKSKVIDIMKKIESAEIGPLVNFGIVVYGDHPPQDTIVTKSFQLTNDHERILRNAQSLPRTGGGDYPEAVVDGLSYGIDMQWREGSHRVLVLIGDAPPHGFTSDPSDDCFPSGCPCGRDPIQEAKRARDSAIIIHSVGVNARDDVKESFQKIAKITEGEYLELENAGRLPELMLNLLMTEVRKMETDIRTYSIVQETQVFNPQYISSALDLSKDEAKRSLDRLKKKGYILPKEYSEIPSIKCDQCGMTNSTHARFCRYCGKILKPN